VITSPFWRGKRFAVLGLARSGAATVRALVASGAEVVAWDSNVAAREALSSPSSRLRGEGRGEGQSQTPSFDTAPLPTLSPQAGRGLLTFADPETIDLAGFDALVVSPGVPLNRHPVAAKARAAGVPIIGDIELFAQARAGLPVHKVVGVTGTNGKSTTVSLIHHILQTAGVPSRLGGNIGLPILEQEPLPEGGVYVLELSSYQIDLTQSLDCDVAVLLNITPDHLDRYDGFEGYAASKARLFMMQSAGHYAVVDVISASEYDVLQQGPGGRIVSCIEDALDFKSIDRREQKTWPSLQGPHNLHNAQAAIEVCDILGIDIETIRAGLRTFTGLPHRMELVATNHGVAFVNDSKATNPESTAPALAAFDRVHWILGGQSKSDDLDACAPSFGHVVRAYTIGAAGPKFADILKVHVPVEQSGTLANAVTSAAAQAKAGETVLLSPACASFDQFRDFEDRGDQFRHAVEALA
jgi:UDP-N-acetylmuramoylalanine--D-glutamate ligase